MAEQLMRRGNTDNAVIYIQHLGQLFQLSLENAREPFVRLDKELNALNSYLLVQRARLNELFDYHLEVEGIAGPEDILVPPMLLQPFTENAILHGFEGLKEKGQLHISIRKHQQMLLCVIEDNGFGFQAAEGHPQKRSLSTVINKERLAILSRQTNTPAQLHIIDKKETTGKSGVRVELIIPYRIKPAILPGTDSKAVHPL